MSKYQQDTIAARYAVNSDRAHGAVIPPLHLSSTFAFPAFGEKGQYDYTRTGNPTRDQLAGAISELEGGNHAVITGSGMAAVHLVTQLLKPGQLLVAANDCYGGCHRLFSAKSERGDFNLRWLPLWNTAASIEHIDQLKPDIVWVETPSNPLLRITDIRVLAAAAHRVGAQLVVDNTFLSPACQQPIALGADIVVHSTTKYINGHSDVVGGAVISRDTDVAEELTWWANCLGLTGSPYDSFQTLRGLRTLKVRMRQHLDNAAKIAAYLSSHPRVQNVYYPGLEHHPGHQIAKIQQNGFGGMVSFELDATAAQIAVFVKTLQHFTLAESLGGVESLVAHPATMTHASMSEEDQLAAGISEGLLRLSIGIEHPRDLLDDLRAGLVALEQTDHQKMGVSHVV